MASNLVSLSFKSGIQRDGTIFQGDLCSDGNWVRFQRGIPKKIGGIKAVNISYARPRRATNILLVPTGAANSSHLYVADNTQVFRSTINNNLVSTAASAAITPVIVGGGANVLWHSTVVISANVQNVVFLQTYNAEDITQTTPAVLYSGLVTAANGAQLATSAIPADASGGMCYAPPYLFLYGNAGYVAYSRSTNPLLFTGGDSGQQRISNDKVIYATTIRGGTNEPALIFWTLSSVVRLTNIGDQIISFKREVLSRQSSILSSRCVIEYNGQHFWPGANRKFYVYNGVTNTMKNITNLNYLFKNLDMNKRQLVFGLVKAQFNELWWFYPEIVNQGDPTIGCTRAVVYNVEDNFWYDTPISMDCGMNYDALGITVTYGRPIVNPDAFNYIWAHETDVNQVVTPGAGGLEVSTPIPSSFTTPIFSFASPFSPARPPGTLSQPTDKWIELRRIEPDFLMDHDADQMQVAVNTKTYAQGAVVTTAPITFTRTTEKIDMRVQGRNMSLTFSSGANFEMGKVQLLIGVGDGR